MLQYSVAEPSSVQYSRSSRNWYYVRVGSRQVDEALAGAGGERT